MKSEHQKRVEKFMRKAKQTVPRLPTVPHEDVRRLRAALILEEAFETIEALGFNAKLKVDGFFSQASPAPVDPKGFVLEPDRKRKIDLIEIVDGCCDVSVVTIGTLSACGVKDKSVLEEIDRTNLAKFQGDAFQDSTGKWIKPTNWKPPRLAEVIQDTTFQMVEDERLAELDAPITFNFKEIESAEVRNRRLYHQREKLKEVKAKIRKRKGGL